MVSAGHVGVRALRLVQEGHQRGVGRSPGRQAPRRRVPKAAPAVDNPDGNSGRAALVSVMQTTELLDLHHAAGISCLRGPRQWAIHIQR